MNKHSLTLLREVIAPSRQAFYSDDGMIMFVRLAETNVLNRFDPRSPAEAEIKYLDGDFRVLRPGAFVRCAVTGVPIPLEELKYWSVERQEAYSSPEAVLKRLHPERVR